jgi:hypothetical protein
MLARCRGRLSLISLLLFGLLSAACCPAGEYENFDVAIYIPVSVVQRFEDPDVLSDDWDRISSQLKVDKVYIEVQRNRNLASDELLERVKKFFVERGVRVAGGMALSEGGRGGRKGDRFAYWRESARALKWPSNKRTCPPFYSLPSNSKIVSISTAQPAGSEATPIALRAATPASGPNTSRINSLKPLITAGC